MGGVAAISRLDAVVVPIPIVLWVGDLQVERGCCGGTSVECCVRT